MVHWAVKRLDNHLSRAYPRVFFMNSRFGITSKNAGVNVREFTVRRRRERAVVKMFFREFLQPSPFLTTRVRVDLVFSQQVFAAGISHASIRGLVPGSVVRARCYRRIPNL